MKEHSTEFYLISSMCLFGGLIYLIIIDIVIGLSYLTQQPIQLYKADTLAPVEAFLILPIIIFVLVNIGYDMIKKLP